MKMKKHNKESKVLGGVFIYRMFMYLCITISLQEMFEKRRRRRESHNAVERRRRDNINERIHGK